MNEININIPYSRFSDIFGCYFYVRMNSGDPSSVTRALDDAIEKYNNAESALQTLRDIF